MKQFDVFLEAMNLLKAHEKFDHKCWLRLVERVEQGYRGWDDRDRVNEFMKKIHGKEYPYDQQDCIDIANFAMFTWNLIENEPMRGVDVVGK